MRRRFAVLFDTGPITLTSRREVCCSPYTPERGKILPRRISGVCATHQRIWLKLINARVNIALLPYAVD
jgi:small subunit ribosomal protein S18